jgi:ATP-dependent DNA helicase RecG
LAYSNIHFPENKTLAKESQKRLAFDELFIIQLSAALVKKEWEKEKVGHQFKIDKTITEKINTFINKLPFQLTSAQNRAVKEILDDLSKNKPMNRFLQGDVGSGKTVVAAIACYLAYLNGYQSLFMAPTEILAKQHFQTLSMLFKDYSLKIGLQTKSEKINNKRNNSPISDFNIIIGTHALLNEKLQFNQVGLVIIDEQHRFGVRQRAMLKEKGINPHLLTMTATPIPRTVALVLYGELDISYLDEMPKGRLPVKTYLIPQEKRADAYSWIKKQIKEKNESVFIVCPLIEESNVETMKSVKAAKKEFENLKEIFSEFKLGLLHGKLKTKEKNKVLEDFRSDKIKILVTTPVVEVGIDIPQATIMIIEAAERFGLAQLHQLRGRVGRSDKQSYCFLFTNSKSAKITERLTFFAKNNLGIKLAEYDLQTRGPGEVYGEKQHGFIDLKIASFTDYHLISQTKKAVDYFLNHYHPSHFPSLLKRIDEYQIKQITRD